MQYPFRRIPAIERLGADRDHPIFFLDPDSLRRSLLASDSALFFAASSGFALALFSLALIFFADAFSELDKGASFIAVLVWCVPLLHRKDGLGTSARVCLRPGRRGGDVGKLNEVRGSAHPVPTTTHKMSSIFDAFSSKRIAKTLFTTTESVVCPNIDDATPSSPTSRSLRKHKKVCEHSHVSSSNLALMRSRPISSAWPLCTALRNTGKHASNPCMCARRANSSIPGRCNMHKNVPLN